MANMVPVILLSFIEITFSAFRDSIGNRVTLKQNTNFLKRKTLRKEIKLFFHKQNSNSSSGPIVSPHN